MMITSEVTLAPSSSVLEIKCDKIFDKSTLVTIPITAATRNITQHTRTKSRYYTIESIDS